MVEMHQMNASSLSELLFSFRESVSCFNVPGDKGSERIAVKGSDHVSGGSERMREVMFEKKDSEYNVEDEEGW